MFCWAYAGFTWSPPRNKAIADDNANIQIFIDVSRLDLDFFFVSRAHFLVNVLLEPVHEEFGDPSAILFGHHLVAVSWQPYIFEVHIRGLHAGLIKPLGCAMGVGTMIAGLSGYIEDRDTLQVCELVSGLCLNPARDEARTIRFFLADGPQFGRLFDWRIITNREIGQTPQTPRP